MGLVALVTYRPTSSATSTIHTKEQASSAAMIYSTDAVISRMGATAPTDQPSGAVTGQNAQMRSPVS